MMEKKKSRKKKEREEGREGGGKKKKRMKEFKMNKIEIFIFVCFTLIKVSTYKVDLAIE